MKLLKYKILLVFFLISLLSSIILSIPTQAPEYCLVGEGGCSEIYNSVYNYTFGIKNSYYGIFIFSSLSLFLYSQIKNPSNKKRKIINYSIIFGSIIALYFLYIQQFVLKSYCQYCLVIDISMLLSLLLVLWKWKE